MNRLMKLGFDDAVIDSIEDLNSSFASGRLKVMYTGANANGSNIPKDVVAAALPSLANVPIVAHYDYQENEIGGHDVELVATDDEIRLRNLTEPCGVVPESATATFVTEADEHGTEHEYLVVEPVILWKRQDVFRHIVEDLGGRVDHSMEINVLSYHKGKGENTVTIDSFEFQALCLLESATPCFEGSALTLFAAKAFKYKMEQMMAELKEAQFALQTRAETSINPPETDVDINVDSETKGGKVLDYTEAAAEVQEPQAITEEAAAESAEATEATGTQETPAEGADGQFELARNIRDSIIDALCEIKEKTPWGEEFPVYYLRDYDAENNIVYAAEHRTDHIFAIPYTLDGDVVRLRVDERKRVKTAYVEYVDAEENGDTEDQAQPGTFSYLVNHLIDIFMQAQDEWSEECNRLEDEVDALKITVQDVEELRAFKSSTEEAQAEAQRNAVFSKFADLDGVEAFEALRSDCGTLTPDEIEEKCFAIRGRQSVPVKFSATESAPIIKIDKSKNKKENEPYGGIFVEYGIGSDN